MRNVRFKQPAAVPWHSFAQRRDLAERTYEEVGNALNISVARVGQLEESGLARLRQCLTMIESGTPLDEAVEACKGRVGRPRKVKS